MSEPKPLASLSPGLLARKGAARPAMRRQTPGLGLSPEPLHGNFADHDDLGWNDMGHDVGPELDHGATVLPINGGALPAEAESPQVLRQQDELADRIASAASAPRAMSAAERSRRAAFTLRIDPERHLRLRLACTIAGRSAQQIIIEAIDEMTARIPEIEELARRMPRQIAK